MEDINQIVAENLKFYRKQSGYSLEYLATISGVSKAMLGQIERKESIPSLTILWKIAYGLKLSFAELTTEIQVNHVTKIPAERVEIIQSKDNGYTIYPYFPFDIHKKFESNMVILEPNGYMKSTPYGSNSIVYITLYDGLLLLDIGDERYKINANDSIKFNGNAFHLFKNESESICRFNMVVHY
ncbi:XRE family transcriptional regulator [Staphylococcus gallinarum]|uniref:XRE family transcriptional regulator n=1 Tax=Staphylococcus gallinarum TaxID=1293 RepID=A0A3A0VKJ4_STAGA|nr:XRE family transcriptional regulator [Staphylococcus gallinarum]RIP32780.1 XRE family transcriptional regulator [Staphylococcus gallinarum]